MSWRPGMAVSDPAAIEDLYILLRTRLDPGVSVQDTQQVRPCKLDVRHPCLPTVLDGHPGIKTLRGGSKLVALFSAGSLTHIHVVDSGILPSALRANADGVIQNRSSRFCRDISTSCTKRPLPQLPFRDAGITM